MPFDFAVPIVPYFKDFTRTTPRSKEEKRYRFYEPTERSTIAFLAAQRREGVTVPDTWSSLASGCVFELLPDGTEKEVPVKEMSEWESRLKRAIFDQQVEWGSEGAEKSIPMIDAEIALLQRRREAILKARGELGTNGKPTTEEEPATVGKP